MRACSTFGQTLLLPLLLLQTAAGATHLEPAAILEQIKSEGAQKDVERLYAPGGQWNDVMAEIGKGQRDWLVVARALHRGTDGGASEELDEAIFFALAPAPGPVLRLLKERVFQVDFVCSSNVSTDYSIAESRTFIQQRLRVLSAVADPDLAVTKTACENGLHQGLHDLDRLGPGD
jgi:hypothetical protein